MRPLPRFTIPRVLPRISLRCLLLLAAAIGLAPLAALDIARVSRAKETALAQAEQNMAILAQQTAAHQQELVQQAFGLLNVLVKIPAVSTASAGCEHILANLRASQSSITSITVVDANGRGKCGTTSAGRFDAGSRPYFLDMKRKRSFVVSDTLVGQATRREILAAALPMLDDSGEVDGAVILGIDLASIRRLITQTSTAYGATVFLLDRSGAPMAMSAPRAVTNATEFYQKLAAAPAGAWQSDLPFGHPTVYGIARMPELGATLVVGIPRATVFAPIERAFWIDLALLVATALGSFGVTVLFVELGVIRGLRHIQNAAQAIVSGRPQHKQIAVPASVREVEQLAGSFNTMVTELEGFAYHDRLTGLGNRRLLERYLSDATRARVSGPFAVLAIDLDEFKPVNDAFGHRTGDQVLAMVAERLIAGASAADMVARLGGDEFIVVLREDQQEVARIAARLRDAIGAPYSIGDAEVRIGCCIGVAFIDRDETVPGPVEMLDRADEALYQAKRGGRSRIVVNGTGSGGPRLVAAHSIAGSSPWQATG